MVTCQFFFELNYSDKHRPPHTRDARSPSAASALSCPPYPTLPNTARPPTVCRRLPTVHHHPSILSQDVILASTLNGAKFFAEKFVDMCGTDLTVDSPGNPFWHTGTSAPINSATVELRLRRPQKFIFRVAQGLSGGVGAPGHGLRKAKSWQRFVDSRIKDGLSQMYGGMKWDSNSG